MSNSLEIRFLSHANNDQQLAEFKNFLVALEKVGAIEINKAENSWSISRQKNCPGGLFIWLLGCLTAEGDYAYSDTGEWRTYFLQSLDKGGTALAVISLGINNEN